MVILYRIIRVVINYGLQQNYFEQYFDKIDLIIEFILKFCMISFDC